MEEKRRRIRRPIRKRRLVPKVEEAPVQNDKPKKQPTEPELAAEKIRVKKRNKEYEKTRKRKTIAFTFDEWEKIEKQLEAAEIDFTEFAKHKLLKTKIKFPLVTKNEAASMSQFNILQEELRRQGVNINQITTKVNQNELPDLQLKKLLEEIKSNLEAIKAKL